MRQLRHGLVYIFDHNEPPALDLFNKAWQQDSAKPLVRFGWAIAHIAGGGNKPKAVEVLEQMANERFVRKRKYRFWYHYYLARGYHALWQLDYAQQEYGEALRSTRNPAKRKLVQRWLDYLKVAYELRDDTIYPNVKVFNMGTPINSTYREYAPVVPAHEQIIWYTARRPGNIGGRRAPSGFRDPFGFYYEDIWKVDYTQDPPVVELDSLLSTDNHDATSYVNEQGTQWIIYRSDEHRFGDLYEVRLDGDSLHVEPLAVNTKWLESSAFIGPDGKLYFTSNRPGGHGGRDIYVAERQADGSWGNIQNLGPEVNSEGDEEGLYITPDGKYLFFASNSPTRSMGGYDLFRAERQPDGFWGKVVNLGPTVNTPDHDLYLYGGRWGFRVYMMSDRMLGVGTQDLYALVTPEWFYIPENAAFLTGKTLFDGRPVASDLYLIDRATGEVVYHVLSDSRTGTYRIPVAQEGKYDLLASYQGFLLPVTQATLVGPGRLQTRPTPYYPVLDWKVAADSNHVLPMKQWYVAQGRDSFIVQWDPAWKQFVRTRPHWLWAYQDTMVPIVWAEVIDTQQIVPVTDSPWTVVGGIPRWLPMLDAEADSFIHWAEGKELPEYLWEKYGPEQLPPLPPVPDSFIVYFEHDKAIVQKPYADSLLTWIAQWDSFFRAVGDTPVLVIQGFACDLGPVAYNLKLSQRRADNVAVILRKAVPAWPIQSEGKGELKPEKPLPQYRIPLHKAVVKIQYDFSPWKEKQTEEKKVTSGAASLTAPAPSPKAKKE